MTTKGIYRKISKGQRGIACLILISTTVIGGIFLIPEIMNAVAVAQDSKPVANIGGNFNAYLLSTVRLDGSFSYDPSGNSRLSYSWEMVSRPDDSSATLMPDGPKASFGADAVGTYKVKLVVSNGREDSEPAYAIITVTKRGYQ